MTEVSKLTLDQEQAFYHLTKADQNLFITGGAGTGKSFVIQHFLKSTKEKIPVLASTGAAAILIGGRTFHSFFGLGLMQSGPRATVEKAFDNKRLRKRLRDTSKLLIDEISMISAEALDCAEQIARMHRESDEPWGGMRIFAIGDFAQLPPVSRGRSKDWAFLGEAWASSEFKRITLNEVMRTEDAQFLKVLADVRVGQLSPRVKKFLDDQTREIFDEEITHLFPRRDQTESFNLSKLESIADKSRKYETIYSGDSKFFDQLKRDAPIPQTLELKKGALVMIRMNDPRQRYVNGTVGVVKSMRDDVVVVETEKRVLEIEPCAFTVVDADGKEVAFAKNFPLNLAYASTIHKIQGATLKRVHVDLTRLWEPGQAYVALSRAQKGSDVTIMSWSASSFKADPLVAQFYKNPNLVQDDEFSQLVS